MDKPKAPATILIVDDSEAIRVLLKAYLREDGYTIIEAVNGADGLNICRQHPPDLILLDVFMPEMDGFELCTILQKDVLLRTIPVIMLTGLEEIESKIRAFDLGAVDYVTKPFNRQEILARVRSHVTISTLTRSLQQTNKELQANQDQLMQGIQAAAKLQKNLLPRHVPDCKTIQFASYFSPCQEIGGDIYNIQRLDDEHLALYILDVSGHGFSAAMMTALVTQALSPSGGIVKRPGSQDKRTLITPPEEVLYLLDHEFPIERFDLYVTIAYLVLNTSQCTFHYSCAGHPPPVQLFQDGTIGLLQSGGPPAGFGALGGSKTWLAGKGALKPGERLFLYTDGLTDHTNREGEPYSQSRLLDSIQKSRDFSLQGAVQNIIGELKYYGKQAAPDDDITLLAMERID